MDTALPQILFVMVSAVDERILLTFAMIWGPDKTDFKVISRSQKLNDIMLYNNTEFS